MSKSSKRGPNEEQKEIASHPALMGARVHKKSLGQGPSKLC